MNQYTIQIEFAEPYRVIEWQKKADRNRLRFLRGYSYARWHRNGGPNQGRPYITGTLVRAAVIRSAELLLWLGDGKYQDISCCPGEFQGSKARIAHGGNLSAKRLRRRATLSWNAPEGCCTPENPCPFCLLLGRYDKAGSRDYHSDSGKEFKAEDYHLKFFNFNAGFKGNCSLETLGAQRVLNRVDQQSGKAEDFFPVWEIDPDICKRYIGQISLSGQAKEHSQAVLTLLDGALALTDRLCGALCRIQRISEPHFQSELDDRQTPDFKQLATPIAEAFEKAGQTVHLRLLADVVRELRRFGEIDPDKELPKGHMDRLGKQQGHFIWDNIKIEGKTPLRKWLWQVFESQQPLNWPAYCQGLGQALYQEAKQKAPAQFPSQRPLGVGDSVQESDKPETVLPGAKGEKSLYEIRIQGRLRAETPFFFGERDKAEETDQTSMRTLRDKQGRFRIPRSVLRGILRRDLKAAFGTGCRTELGHGSPCQCPVCQLMRAIAVKDGQADFREPPQIRHRIRLDPDTATVAEGALFDTEVGPAGLSFPFELRLRHRLNQIPRELETVLFRWSQGQAFLSGNAGTGKGRFVLEGLKQASWNLADSEEFARYRAFQAEDASEDVFEDLSLSSKTEEPMLWEAERISLEVNTPFITKDPVLSLIQGKGRDAICFRAPVVDAQGNSREQYMLKGESLRGILRTLVGRRDSLLTEEHEDCRCLLCRLFGNAHQAGAIRIEDLLLQSEPTEKAIDRVAIDRFTAGAKDKHKFDMVPLEASPDQPLCFEGRIWKSVRLDKEAKKALDTALKEFYQGRFALGGFGNVGYGWIRYQPTQGKKTDPIPDHLKLMDETNNPIRPETDANKLYWPHCFLAFGPGVKRENDPPSHLPDAKKTLFSGRIRCALTTQTPLIIPDTGASHDGKGENRANHKEYDFFRLGGTPCIPGSEIRGMLSAVYEALTNSCLRVFDEKKRLSWRMEADAGNQELFKPGRVIPDKNGGFKIKEMEEIRYPFYDKCSFPNKEKQEFYFQWDKKLTFNRKAWEALKKDAVVPGQIVNSLKRFIDKSYDNGKSFVSAIRENLGKNSTRQYGATILEYAEDFNNEVPFYEHPTPTDQRLLSLVNGNRKHLNLDGISHFAIIKHRGNAKRDESFMFVATPAANQQGYTEKDVFARKSGYLKITGPNKVEKENKFSPDLPLPPDHMGKVIHNVFPSLRKERVRCGENQDMDCVRKRLRPEFAASEKDKDHPDKGYTYSMTKRCERAFLEKSGESFDVTPLAVKKFEILVEEYRKNAEQYKTPDAFRTLLPENGTLNPGELIYFRSEGNKAVEIIPVRISRTVDDQVLGEKFSKGPDLRPCVREPLDEEAGRVLKEKGIKALYQHHPQGLCPGCALFGTPFYRSRLAVGFAFPRKSPAFVKNGERITLPLLERPRHTWSMPSPSARVPGRKFYLHHQGWKAVAENSDKEKKTENNRSVQAVAENAEFGFELRFENLRDWELGLLLYSLNLEPELAHKLGMGKALGFGSVRIAAEEIVDIESETPIPTESLYQAAKEKLKNIWNAGTDADLSEKLSDFFKLLWYVSEDPDSVKVRYPALKKDDENPENGYMELKEKPDYKDAESRKTALTTPWKPWKG